MIGDEVGKKTWTSNCNILIGTRIAACNQKNGEHTIAIGYESLQDVVVMELIVILVLREVFGLDIELVMLQQKHMLTL